MFKVSDLLGLTLVISSFLLCSAEQKEALDDSSDPAFKTTLIEDILRKVCNLSMNTFSNKAPEEKAKLLIKIEGKLNISAKSLGPHGEKYVKLIMRGVRSKAFENEADDSKISGIINTVRQRADESAEQATHTTSSKSKNELVNNIASKIELLAKTYLTEAKTQDERQKVIENIKRKFIESADRKHEILHNKHDEIKKYVDLVAKGIEVMMQRNANNAKRRRMEFVYTDNINLNKDSRNRLELMESVKPGAVHNNELSHSAGNDIKKPKSVMLKTTKDNNFQPTSSCDEVLEETCNKIKLVKTFQCQSDSREIHILKLCDGVGDCLDFSDEQHCAKQAIECIQSANRLMTNIDTSLSRNCNPDLLNDSILAKQNKILSNVLQNQLTFLHRHSIEGSSTYSRRVFNADTKSIKHIVNEAVTVVDTLSSALLTSLCSKYPPDNVRKLGEDDFEKDLNAVLLQTSTWSPEVCKCDGQKCISMCTPACQQICWEKYSLSQWQCSATTGDKTVSLDMICDGKLDCYDESDEKDCTRDIGLGKFEATQMYNYIIRLITAKTTSVQFESVRNGILNLHKLVLKLQKASMKRYADNIEVKRIRERCFSEMTEIYDSAVRYANSADESVDIYVFLLSLNERLVSAMKRSHTGNDKIISSDGCICRGYQCALPKCSKACIRACTAEPKLTRYFCSGSSELNNSVPIDVICNGKKNCRDGDDEKDCNKESCRSHHLMVLRHKLRDVGKMQEGTALGEALRSWRIKVTANLMVAEGDERPTPPVIRELVHGILHDLVMTYATVEDTRRSDLGDSSMVFAEFYMWSRVVMETLKSCGQ